MIDHHARVNRALAGLIAEGRRFLADDVHARVPRSTRAWLDTRPAVLGAVFKHLHDAGQIRQVGWTDSPRRPGYPSRVWEPVARGD